MSGSFSPGALVPARSGRYVRQAWKSNSGVWTVEVATGDPANPRRVKAIDWYAIPGNHDPRLAAAAALDLAALPEGEEFFVCEDDRRSDFWEVISVEARDRLVAAGLMEADTTYDPQTAHSDNPRRIPTGLWRLTMTGRNARVRC